MDFLMDILQKKQALVAIAAYAIFAYNQDMDKMMLGVSLVVMLAIYVLGSNNGVASDSLQKELSKLTTENDGLKRNLVDVYRMVQGGQVGQGGHIRKTNEGPPPPENPNIPPPREMPSKHGPPPDEEGKPYM